MRLPEDRQNLVERYFSGLLGEAELQDFEARLAADKDFGREVERQQAILDEAVQEGVESHLSLQKRVKEIHERIVGARPKNKRRVTGLRWVVAAAAILLLVFATFLLSNKKRSSADLFAEYAQPDKISLVEKGSSDAPTLLLAETAFNAARYAEALPYFTAHLQGNPDDLLVLLYKGISLLHLGEFAAAESDLKRVAGSRAVFRTEAEWYLALSLLKQGKVEACITRLGSLVARPGFGKKQAALDLLEELR